MEIHLVAFKMKIEIKIVNTTCDAQPSTIGYLSYSSDLKNRYYSLHGHIPP